MSSIQEDIKNCPICDSILPGAVDRIDERRLVHFKCSKCGPLKLGMDLVYPTTYYQKNSDKGLQTAAILRKLYEETNQSSIFVSDKDLLLLVNSKIHPKTPYEKAIQLFLNISRYSKVGEIFDIRNQENLTKIITLSSLYESELDYYLKYLDNENLIEYKYIEQEGPNIPDSIVVTMHGWKKYHELKEIPTKSTQVFVAMSFGQTMDELFEKAIKPAIISAGYEAYRIDKVEHNDKICDLILAEVKKSRFIVADITSHKKGVYFEAGYAMGLGIPVIWCCKDDEKEIENMHFDTRQYNHILWKDVDDLRDRLEKRIKATNI